MTHFKRRASALGLLALLCLPAHAADSDPDATGIGEVVVIGVTPVPGLNIDIDKVPGNLQSLMSQAMRQNGPASLANALDTRLSSISLNDTLADPFQADILFRGFEASPVLGTPQGMAVYQNGVRINEAFGDTVNWDLIPDIAIQRIDILSSTPVYGLNALGGAMSVTMKNAFSHEGMGGEFSGGSFAQKTGEIEYGYRNGIFGVYGAARFLNQGGWRHYAQDHLKQYYLDLSLHPADLQVDLSYARANNQLAGQGAAPFQSLAVDRRNVFTGPQQNLNDVDFFTLNANYSITPKLGAQAVAYYRNYRQAVANGDNSDYTACTGAGNTGLLCNHAGEEPLIDSTGAPIPDITNGGSTVIGQNDYERIHSQGWGGSLQITSALPLAGHGNAFALGASVDTSTTGFSSVTELGVLDASLMVLPSPYFVNTPEGHDSATPVSLSATNKSYGFYLTDTFDALDALSLTVAARYNVAKVDLTDRLGSLLDGNNRFIHFNPSAGLTYRLSKAVTLYGSYAINNRAPTASEIECSDPQRPCLLPSSLAADPPTLKQVVAHAMELGVRGKFAVARDTRLAFNLSAYRTDLDDDIYGVSTSVSQGVFPEHRRHAAPGYRGRCQPAAPAVVRLRAVQPGAGNLPHQLPRLLARQSLPGRQRQRAGIERQVLAADSAASRQDGRRLRGAAPLVRGWLAQLRRQSVLPWRRIEPERHAAQLRRGQPAHLLSAQPPARGVRERAEPVRSPVCQLRVVRRSNRGGRSGCAGRCRDQCAGRRQPLPEPWHAAGLVRRRQGEFRSDLGTHQASTSSRLPRVFSLSASTRTFSSASTFCWLMSTIAPVTSPPSTLPAMACAS